MICEQLGTSIIDMVRAGYEETELENTDTLSELMRIMDDYAAEKERYIALQSVLIEHLVAQRGIDAALTKKEDSK